MIHEYDIKQAYENANQLAIDFDGVIHKNSKGFYDGTIYDEPMPGALDAIKQLAEKYDIVIFSAKVKPDRPLVNGKTGAELVWEWLEKYNLSKYIKEVTSEKPRAVFYIDDKAIRFIEWEDTLNKITNKYN
tara:strand:+ start:102 stop:494 length:393 start_codon:yes stop_codon:yes gene_type:complete